MQIRKFVIAVVSTFDDKGNKKAEASMKEVRRQAAELTKQYQALDRAQEAAAESGQKVAGSADDVDDEMAKLAREISHLDDKIEGLNKTIGKSRKRLDDLGKRSLKDVGASFQGASDKLGKFRSAMAPIGEVAATAARGLAVIGGAALAVGAGVIKVGTEFESLRAQLKTVEGSAAGASKSFGLIKDFAASTPFQVENLTKGFIALRVRGVDPTKETLTALGDLGSAFGADFEQVTEAITAASTGELEQLKKFGITGKVAGDTIALSFKGQTLEIGKSAEEATAAIATFGRMEGIQGAMAEQSTTTAGVLSNLGDTIASFADEVAQMGVLEEFKGLLGDVSGLAGSKGLAGILAEALVTGLQAVRDALGRVTEEDISDFLRAAVEMAKAFATAIGFVGSALENLTATGTGTTDGIENMTLAIVALIAAFMGPAGLVVAAIAVGGAMGNMLAGVEEELNGTADAIGRVEDRISTLRANIAGNLEDIAAIDARIEAGNARTAKDVADRKKVRDERLERQTGGAGAGLLRQDVTQEDRGFQAQFIELNQAAESAGGGAESTRKRKLAEEKLFTGAGRQVLAGVRKAEASKIAQVEQRARREARKAGKSGADIDAAAASARASAGTAAAANRRKAFETAEKTLAETGSAEAATTAAAGQIAGRGKKGGLGKKGKKGKKDDFFDFEKRAEAAAKSQAEKFAQSELERLRSENVAIEDAIEQSRSAGKARAALLTQKFLDAGKIFEPAKEDNILDILGLKGPGSVLEGRPSPEVLTISNVFTVNLINGDFNQANTFAGGAEGLAEATGTAGAPLVEAFQMNAQIVIDLIDQQQRLQADRMISAAGGGTSTQGPPG